MGRMSTSQYARSTRAPPESPSQRPRSRLAKAADASVPNAPDCLPNLVSRAGSSSSLTMPHPACNGPASQVRNACASRAALNHHVFCVSGMQGRYRVLAEVGPTRSRSRRPEFRCHALACVDPRPRESSRPQRCCPGAALLDGRRAMRGHGGCRRPRGPCSGTRARSV